MASTYEFLAFFIHARFHFVPLPPSLSFSLSHSSDSSDSCCLVAFKFNGCPKKQATQFFISHVATLSASCPVGHTSPPPPLQTRQCVAHQVVLPRYNINCAWRIKNQRQRPLKCHYIFIRYDAIS